LRLTARRLNCAATDSGDFLRLAARRLNCAATDSGDFLRLTARRLNCAAIGSGDFLRLTARRLNCAATDSGDFLRLAGGKATFDCARRSDRRRTWKSSRGPFAGTFRGGRLKIVRTRINVLPYVILVTQRRSRDAYKISLRRNKSRTRKSRPSVPASFSFALARDVATYIRREDV